jgi:anhydro-N-acetylmuramic acid kinase
MKLLESYKVSATNSSVKTTNSLGIEVDWVEAIAFAWFAFAHVQDLQGNLPDVTGASRKAVLGALYKAK